MSRVPPAPNALPTLLTVLKLGHGQAALGGVNVPF
jgi:hypothetical protein